MASAPESLMPSTAAPAAGAPAVAVMGGDDAGSRAPQKQGAAPQPVRRKRGRRSKREIEEAAAAAQTAAAASRPAAQPASQNADSAGVQEPAAGEPLAYDPGQVWGMPEQVWDGAGWPADSSSSEWERLMQQLSDMHVVHPAVPKSALVCVLYD